MRRGARSSEPCPGLPAAHRAAGRRKRPCSSGRPRFLPSFLPALLRSELTRSRHPRAPRGAAGASAAPAAAAPTGVLPRATRKPRPQRHTSPVQDAPCPRPQPSCSPTTCPKPNTLTAIVAPARQGAWPWTPGSDRGRRSLGAHPTGSLAAVPPGCRAAHPPCAGGSALGSSPRDNTQTCLPTSGISSQLLAPPRSRHTAPSPSAAAPLSEGGCDAAPCHGRMSPSPARTTPPPHTTCWALLGVSCDGGRVAPVGPSWRSQPCPGVAVAQRHVCPRQHWPCHPSCANKAQRHTSRRSPATVLPAAPERHLLWPSTGIPGAHQEPAHRSRPDPYLASRWERRDPKSALASC